MDPFTIVNLFAADPEKIESTIVVAAAVIEVHVNLVAWGLEKMWSRSAAQI